MTDKLLLDVLMSLARELMFLQEGRNIDGQIKRCSVGVG